MDLLAAYIDAELAGEDKPSNETIKQIVESHGGTIDASNPNVILTPDGEIRLDGVLNDASSGTDNPEEINKTIIELNKQINDLKGQLATANADKQNLQAQVTELNASITDLNTQVASWKKKAEDGEITISEKDAQISNLNSQITAKNSEIEEKQNRIQELEENVETLTSEKQALETQVATLNARVAELEGKQATGDALAADVLEGKTFSTANGVNLTGTMVNRGTLNFNPSESTTQTIQTGYYEGGSISTKEAYKVAWETDTRKTLFKSEPTWEGDTAMLGNKELYVYKIPKPSDCLKPIQIIYSGESIRYGLQFGQIWWGLDFQDVTAYVDNQNKWSNLDEHDGFYYLYSDQNTVHNYWFSYFTTCP